MLNAEERSAGLRELPDLAGRHAEEDRRLRLFDSDVDRANPGIVHAEERLEARPRIDDRDAHLVSSSTALARAALMEASAFSIVTCIKPNPLDNSGYIR